MTIDTSTNKVIANGNGSTTNFTYSFIIPNADSLQVIYTDLTGTDTTLNPSLYTVTGLGDPAGGYVQYPLVGSPIATGTRLTILRIVPLVQDMVISNQGTFNANALEDMADNLEMQIQQINEATDRTIKLDVTVAGDAPILGEATPGYYLQYNFDGTEIVAVAGGVGSGDVTGPTSAVANNFSAYNGITGKLIKDSGYNSSSFDAAGVATAAVTAHVAAANPHPQYVLGTALTTKGDLITRDSSAAVRLPVGLNGKILTADSAQSSGLSYKYAWQLDIKTVFGAVGDGVADDTAAIQAGIDYIETNGGTLNFGDGKYRITTPISKVFTYTTLGATNRPSIRGNGSGVCQILWDGANTPTLYAMSIYRTDSADNVGLHAHSIIEGIGFRPINSGKNNYVGGLYLAKWAYLNVRDIWIDHLSNGLFLDQVISSRFEKVDTRFNNYGVIGIGSPASALATDIYANNALTFVDCETGANSLGGFSMTDGCFHYMNGAVEGNGTGATSGSGYGMKIIRTTASAGEPYACKVSTYFEGNGTTGNMGSNATTADLWIVHQTTADNVVYDVSGSNFNQLAAAYAPHGVYLDKQSATALGLSVKAAFMDYGGYSAHASRTYVEVTTTNASRLDNVNLHLSPANYYNQSSQKPLQVAGTVYSPGTIAGVGRYKSYCASLIQGAAQTIPNATATALIWANASSNVKSVTGVDMWTISNPTKIYIPLGATFIKITANVRYVSSAVDNANYQLFAYKNGAVFSLMPYNQLMSNAGTFNHTMNISSGIIPVVGGTDYIEIMTQQNIGASLTTDYATQPESTWVTVEIIE